MADRLLPVLVAVGGFFGATARHLLGTVVAGPEGTLLANVCGSFVLALVVGVVRSTRLRVFLMTGLLSSFTTYSTFAVETAALDPGLAVANVLANYVLAFFAVIAGRAVTRGALL